MSFESRELYGSDTADAEPENDETTENAEDRDDIRADEVVESSVRSPTSNAEEELLRDVVNDVTNPVPLGGK